MRYDLAVIGAGLMGMSVAFEARARGMSVIVLEAESCARQASSASAGGVRSLNRHPSEIPLTRAALPLWEELSARLGAACGFKRTGQIRVAEDDAGLAALEARARLTADLGFDHERLVDRDGLRDRLPAVAAHCVGGLATDDDGFADPLATSHAYRRAIARTGVEIREHTRVIGLERGTPGVRVTTRNTVVEAGAVVNAAGAWGTRLAALAGERMPLRTAALQMIVTARVAQFVTPVVGVQGRKLSLKQTAEGSVVIGGAFEGDVATGAHGPERGIPRPVRAAQSLANAVAVFEGLRDARVTRIWAGLEGMAPDALPYLGASERLPGLIHAFGFSGHGFALAPLIGPLVADLLEGRDTGFDLAPFAPGRGSGGDVTKETRKRVA